MSGLLGLEFLPEVGHVHPQVVRVPDARRAPYFLEQVPVRDDFAGVLHQQRQQAEFGRRQMDFAIVELDEPMRRDDEAGDDGDFGP